MSRLNTLPPDELQGEEKKYHEEISAFTKSFAGDTFTTSRPDGALIGPFGALLHTPAVGKHFFGLASALGDLPGLPPQAREIAILVVGAKYNAAYELYAHGNVAETKVGLEAHIVEEIKDGRKPQGLSEQGDTAYDVAEALVSRPGKGVLEKRLWERAVEGFGEEGAVALVHYVGYYAYTCVLLNGFDVLVPEDGKGT